MDSRSIPKTMRAWVRPARGPAAESLKLIDTMETPTIAADSAEVLVRVAYVALQWSSEMTLKLLPQLPGMPIKIPEIEYAGVVVAAGSQAPAALREVGARVQGFRSIESGFLAGRGVLCEYVKSKPDQLVRLPDFVELATASGMLGCGSTALKMIRTAGLKSGERVLINGASSSVGSVLAQICKSKGAIVVATASGRNEELVRGLGVDEFIDYTAHSSLPDFLKSKYAAEPFDWVFDCAGVHELYAGSPGYLKPSGAVINIGSLNGIWQQAWNWFIGSWLPTWLGGIPRRYIMFSTPPDHDSAIYMTKLIDEGTVRVLIDSIWPMEDAIKGYEKVATKRARGKVVIKVDQTAGA